MPSCLFTHAHVFTGRSESDFATAFVVEDGLVRWVGHVGDASQPVADSEVDLQGRTVVPGFIDVHTHPTFCRRSSMRCLARCRWLKIFRG